MKWNVTCHYNEEKEPTDFIECAALFTLEKTQGWDFYFRPIIEPDVDVHSNIKQKRGDAI